MHMPPTSEWTDKQPEDVLAKAPLGLKWEEVGEVRHVFTHFALKLGVWRVEAPKRFKAPEGAAWVNRDEALAGLPTVGRKAVKLALAGLRDPASPSRPGRL
jgi:A/G-specific adenine glycosylase